MLNIFKSNTKTYIIEDIISYNQHPKYPTGCESVALYILLKHYHIKVTLSKIIACIPKGVLPYEKNGIKYGSDPEKVFVGDPTDRNSYGIYNYPIANVANKFRKGATSKNNLSITKLKKIIRHGNPVIVWVNLQNTISDIIVSKSWHLPNSKKIVYWLRGEHAVVAYGYDKEGVYISDPYNGQKYKKKWDIFTYYYNAMGKRCVYYNK